MIKKLKKLNLKISNHLSWLALVFMLMGLFFAHQASASVIPKPSNNLGLVGYWSMEDGIQNKATDFSGQGNTGTLTNFALSGSTSNWVGGKVGTALNFDGNNDYVNISDSNSLDITNAITMSAWVYVTTSRAGSDNQYVIDKQNLYSLFVEDNETISFYGVNLNVAILTTSDTIPLNTWTYLTATYDKDAGSNNAKIYINGTLSTQATRTNALGTDANPARIGCYSNSGGTCLQGWAFSGTIDDVRLYNRALSPTEVTTLYTNSVRRIANKAINKTGLVGYWSFEDATSTKATDFSGQGNTGTLNGAAGANNLPQWTAGKVGTALNFDGTDDYVSIPDANSLDFASSFSISSWIYLRQSPVTNYTGIVTKYDGGINFNYILQFDATGTKLVLSSDGFSAGVTSTNAVPVNTWYYVVGVYNASLNKAYIYANGVLDGEQDITGSPSTDSNIVRIGAQYGDGQRSFPGSLDDVRIYNRALSTTEITTLYTNSKTTHLNASQNLKLTDGLVGQWSFNGSDLTTTTAYDRSGQNNNGTLNGTGGANNKPQPIIGKIGQALNFDGTDDIMTASDSSSLDLSTAGTISFWYSTASGNNVSIGKWDGINNQRAYLLQLSGGKIYWLVSSNGIDQPYFLSTNTYTDSGWHHLVGVYNGSTLVVYLDGVSIAGSTIGTVPASIFNSNYNLSTNYTYVGPATVLSKGSMDDVRIYNRALTPSEALNLYNQGK